MNRVKSILDRLYRKLGIASDSEFCSIYNIKKNTLSTWKKRDSIPYELLERISQNANLSLDWVLLGKEEHGNTVEEAPISYFKQDKKPTQIKYYPEIYASAGYGANNDDEGAEIMTLEHFMLTTLQIIDPSQIEIIRIHGDSMEPDFRNGEYVIAERVPGIEAVKTGNVIIANISGEIFIKRIEKIPFQERIILKSCNNAYDPIIIEGSNLKHLTITAIVRGSVKPH